ncbi:MAG: Gfo/Idh/MocA family oxidoreductase [Verrucomicrobiae bacterium]|nr:Gfo/Idh/MocA family oxidoreductase [Verrucomicrobiae bacterium]
MSTESSSTSPSRREFLRRTTGALAVAGAVRSFKTPVYGQNQAPSANVVGANNRIVCGYIGVGGQGAGAHVGQDLAHHQEFNVALAAVCDVSKHRVEAAKQQIAGGGAGPAEGYEDYRKLLARKDIDAIYCATVDHWHTRICCDAMEAGKHVYVEKPMTRYLAEGFEIYDMVRKTGKVLQVGSQGCSDDKWHQAAKWIRDGKIGKIVMLQGSYMRNNPWGEWNYTIQPWCTAEDTNWAMWQGDQIKKQMPFNADHYFRWRKYYPYCSGLLGDLFPHKLHPYMLATGKPEFPTRVAAIGSKAFKTDLFEEGRKPEQVTKYVRDVPEIIELIAEFPSGYVMHITSSTVNELGTQEVIRGHRANLTMAGNRVELRPERPFAEEIDAETSPAFGSESVASHHRNFYDSIRANKEPNANIDLAVKVQTVISLAEASDRIGTMCYFDETTRKVKDGMGRELQVPYYGWDADS